MRSGRSVVAIYESLRSWSNPHNVCFCCGRFKKKGWAGRPQPTQVITDAPPNPIRTRGHQQQASLSGGALIPVISGRAHRNDPRLCQLHTDASGHQRFS